MNNVSTIVDNALCSACGACVRICPVNAIDMIYNSAGFLHAFVDESKCIKCRKCLNVCSGNSNNVTAILPDNWCTGDYIQGFYGHSNDKDIRFRSQSGGIVTSLLLHLIDTGAIDGCIVTDFDEELQRPISKYTRGREGIMSATGSYYSQTAPLTEIPAGERYAIVTLGCQSESLKLQALRHEKNLPALIIGLVCEGQYSIDMTYELANKAFPQYIKKGEELKHFRPREKKTADGRAA